MNNFLLLLAGLFVLALSALFAAPLFVDWNDYRHVFEQQASRLVGRSVNVAGDVSLTLLPAPYLKFENVNVADAEGRYDTPFLSAKSFTVWLSVPPLLRGAVEAREVQLDQPVLNLHIAADGTGNWRDVGRADARLPFVPRSVALDSVKLIDASVTLARGDADPYLQLDHFDGELSATSLQGPYKLAGHFQAFGVRMEVRLSTGRRDPNGAFRLKAVVRDEDGHQNYLVDGDVTGLAAVPRFQGAFEARFTDAVTSAEAAERVDAADDAVPLAIKAKVEAAPERAALSDLEIRVKRGNKPQTIRGRVDVAYDAGLAVDGELVTRWVDIDALANPDDPSTGASAPLRGAMVLASRVLDAASRVKHARITFAFEQAVLGGDLLQDVEAELETDGGAIAIKRLAARLPGDNRLSLRGSLAGKKGAPAFSGPVEIEGEKLSRLLSWVGAAAPSAAAAQDGAFSLKGALAAEPGSLVLEEAEGALFGSHFSGEFRYRMGKEQELVLLLKSEQLDIARIVGPQAKLVTLPALFQGWPDDAEDSKDPWPLALLADTEARIDLDIGAVTLPGLGLSALRTGLRIVGGEVNIQRLDLRSDTGLALKASGRLTGLQRKPDGNITLSARADTPAAVSALASLLGIEAGEADAAAQLAALAPAILNATVRSASGDAAGLTAKVEGTLGGSAVGLTVEIDRPPAAWRSGDLSVAVSMRNGDGKRLLRQLIPRLESAELASLGEGPGALTLVLKGAVPDGLDTALRLSAGGLTWRAMGKASLAAERPSGFDGRIHATLPDVVFLLRLVGAQPAPGRTAHRIELDGVITASASVYDIRDLVVSTTSETFRGMAKVDLSGTRPRLAADIMASTASLPILLEPLVAWDAGAAPVEGLVRGVTRTAGYWPDERLNAGLLNGFDGALKLRAKRLRLTGAVALDDGEIEARLNDGVLEIATLGGALYGGALKATATLAVKGNGLRLEANAEAKKMRLERITGSNGKPLASGAVSLDLSFKSVGLSPHGLAAALNGSGKLIFSEGEIRRLAPGVARAVAQDLGAISPTNASAGLNEKRLEASIRRHLASSRFAYQPFDATIEIRNGVARIEEVALKNSAGRATVTTFVELTSLKLDSEWVLTAGHDADGEAPQVALAFAGPLDDLGKMQPGLDTQALQRYVTIRRMEQDVERLEKLQVPKPADVEKAPVPAPDAGKRKSPPQQAPSQVAPEKPPVQKRARPPQAAPPDAVVSTPPKHSVPPADSVRPEPPRQRPAPAVEIRSRPLPPPSRPAEAAPPKPSPQPETPRNAEIPRPLPSEPAPTAPAQPAGPGDLGQPSAARQPEPGQPALPWLAPDAPQSHPQLQPQPQPLRTPPTIDTQQPAPPAAQVPLLPPGLVPAVPDASATPQAETPPPAARPPKKTSPRELFEQDGG